VSDVYYDPEKFGLVTVGEVEWGDACYSFDLTVVWRRTADGQLLYASDMGCSCPSPFDSTGVDDLTPVTVAELQAVLDKLNAEQHDYDGPRDAQIADLMLAVTK
jgi:hypothetical protein